MRARVAIALVAAAAAVAGFALWYPNRTVRTDNDYWGDPLIRMRWGKPVELIVDRDRNGFPEVRASYSGYDELSPHATPDEVWEDWNADGYFERHLTYSSAPRELILEVDTTGDRQYDLKLRGQAAEDWIKEHPWPGVRQIVRADEHAARVCRSAHDPLGRSSAPVEGQDDASDPSREVALSRAFAFLRRRRPG